MFDFYDSEMCSEKFTTVNCAIANVRLSNALCHDRARDGDVYLHVHRMRRVRSDDQGINSLNCGQPRSALIRGNIWSYQLPMLNRC